MTEKELASYFRYLDQLRKSGRTNMFGAAPYLEEAFDIDRVHARRALRYWQETFSHEKSPEDRAAKAIASC